MKIHQCAGKCWGRLLRLCQRLRRLKLSISPLLFWFFRDIVVICLNRPLEPGYTNLALHAWTQMEALKGTTCWQLMQVQEWSNSKLLQQMPEPVQLYCQKCLQIVQIVARHTAELQQMLFEDNQIPLGQLQVSWINTWIINSKWVRHQLPNHW